MTKRAIRFGVTVYAFTRSAPMRYTAHLEPKDTSPSILPSALTARTALQRPAPTSSLWLTGTPTTCLSASPAARTTTGPITSPKNSYRLSSRTFSKGSHCLYTVMAVTCATGSMSKTIAKLSTLLFHKDAPAKSTTWVAITKRPTWKLYASPSPPSTGSWSRILNIARY